MVDHFDKLILVTDADTRPVVLSNAELHPEPSSFRILGKIFPCVWYSRDLPGQHSDMMERGETSVLCQ